MKKILFLLSMLLIANSCFAAEIDRKVAINTNIDEAQQIVLDLIKQYEGVITVKEKDLQNHTYVVDYNKHTFLAYLGVSNDKWAKGNYAQAAFSCQLKPLNDNDTLIIMRKHSYHGGLLGASTFNHYKKFYNELKFNGKQVVKYKKYPAKSKL